MRRTVALMAVSILGLLAPPRPAAAESTRTLRLELTGDSTHPFAVENLAGTMRVAPGAGDAVVAVATVHAESDELAASMRFEQVRNEKGVPTLRVRYPVDRHTTFRFPQGKDQGTGSFLAGFLGLSGSNVKYDGQRVSVSSGHGVLLYADVEVQVPKKTLDATFKNHVGPMHGQGVQGKVRFDTGSGNVTLKQVSGEVVADTGSGDVTASDVEGSFSCDTGSGECDLTGFKGESVKCDTGSGDVNLRSVTARRIAVDTGSGDVHVDQAEAEEFDADTGSGSIELEARGARLTRVDADTGSGDVTLRLGPDASFEAVADQGSGRIVSRYADTQPILKGKELVGYRRGDAKARIRVETGSGDLILEPGR